MDENGVLMYEYDPVFIERKYEVFDLRVIHRSHRTGFEETKVSRAPFVCLFVLLGEGC